MSIETWKSKPDDEKLIGTLIGANKDIKVLGIAYRDTTTYDYQDFTVFNVKCTKCGREFTVARYGIHKASCRVCGNSSKYNYDRPGYLEEIVGNKYGKLTVIGFDHFKEGKPLKGRTKPRRFPYYKCRCDCGNETIVERSNLINNKVLSCGCSNKKPGNTHIGTTRGVFDDPQYINEIVGKKFNMLTVLKFDHFKEGPIPKGRTKPRRHAIYLCKCDCGNTKLVDRANLTRGDIKSCGCINFIAQKKHGNSRDRIYNEWRGMKQRCYNPNETRYSEYGGRGITVCDEWLGNTPAEGFVAFRDWALANGYDDSLWIDRIDNDGPYAPWNCQWVTPEEQAWNKQQSIRIQYNGKNMNIKEFKEASNSEISIRTLQRRFSTGPDALSYTGWSYNDKLFIPELYGRDQYRKDHNIKDVFIFDKDSPYK